MSLLTTAEAENLVSQLSSYKLSDIGGSKWSQQHEICEKLKFGASMQQLDDNKHDPYIVNEIVLGDKLSILIKNLIVIEIWKNKVFPILTNDKNRNILQKTANHILSTKLYMILYNESVLLSLLEIILSNSGSVSSYIEDMIDKNEDLMLELIHYLYRKMVRLTIQSTEKSRKNDNTENLQNGSILIEDVVQFDYDYSEHKQSESELNFDKLNFDFRKLEFVICSHCVSSFYLLTQHLGVFSLSMVDAVLNTHDFVNLVVLLIEQNPFLIKKIDEHTRLIYKFEDSNAWKKYDLTKSSSDHLRLSKLEGQLWLIIYNIMFDIDCNKKYAHLMQTNSYSKDVFLQLKRHLSGQENILCQQIPLLNQLKRMLEELSLADLSTYVSPIASESHDVASLLQIQVVPQFRENLLKKTNFDEIASSQIENIFSKYDMEQYKSEMKRFVDIYNFDVLESALPDPKCAQCGAVASKRCSNCKLEWYCSRQCQLKGWKAHKQICSFIKSSK